MVPPPPGAPGRALFGEKAFRGALAACAVLVAGGLVAALLGSGALASVGVSLVVLGALGLLTGAGGLLVERHLGRRRPAPPDRPGGPGRGQPVARYRRNGQGPRLDPDSLRRSLRRRR